MTRTSRLRSAGATATLIALALALALVLGACGSGKSALAPAGGGTSSPGSITIGSANFPESALLADIYAGALKAKGVKVSTKLNIGGREVYIPALQDGSIDLVSEYTGVLLDYFTKNKLRPGSPGPEQIYSDLAGALPAGLAVLQKSPAQDVDTLAVTKATADKFHLTSISDLASHAKDMTLGAAPEWAGRQEGILGLKSVYGLTFKTFKHLDAGGPLTIGALKNGDIDVGNIFSTDSSLKTDNFVALTDPKHLFTAENVVPLIRKSKDNTTVTATLNAVSGALTTQNLTAALAQVQVNKTNPEQVAAQFLKQHGLS